MDFARVEALICHDNTVNAHEMHSLRVSVLDCCMIVANAVRTIHPSPINVRLTTLGVVDDLGGLAVHTSMANNRHDNHPFGVAGYQAYA